ncbi:hypothetical protein AVEN_103716-1 [Araneus ventricosus]|uniref:Uncharacterized protein n=1 Tax=Araneus ventricosus TaxID=182803 RepID=A0A4Y2T5R3_ARAVE|nr:hypothetical protein AVEN_187275-1 [Araneus ventricosus]GBN95952.1 hypothetical protein AVEN_103716-1 [Araneus ventricosus]
MVVYPPHITGRMRESFGEATPAGLFLAPVCGGTYLNELLPTRNEFFLLQAICIATAVGGDSCRGEQTVTSAIHPEKIVNNDPWIELLKND